MARTFETPTLFRSDLVSGIKRARRDADQRKKDVAPSVVRRGRVTFKLARHFGFCYGVENAVDIAYRAVRENAGKRVFLLSEMIHNPAVNADLAAAGVRFVQTTSGEELIPLDSLTPDDVVILPAFGVTVETEERLARLGIDAVRYDATCPFVTKVWRRAAELGRAGFTVVVHGKHYHEETRATFSHAARHAPAVIIRDMAEARLLGRSVAGEDPPDAFFSRFPGRHTPGFSPDRDLGRLGVVNQTTMLAGDTAEIGRYLRSLLADRYGEEEARARFADTRDTLCYATTENQAAAVRLAEEGGDLAVVIGGHNSSNTAHLAELCARRVPTYHVEDEHDLRRGDVRHWDAAAREWRTSPDWLPEGVEPLTVLVTAGASTPDSTVDRVLDRVARLAEGPEICDAARGT